jgi:tetratricopeptide (TPR) repeat protein
LHIPSIGGVGRTGGLGKTAGKSIVRCTIQGSQKRQKNLLMQPRMRKNRKELAEVWNHKGENHLTRREFERAKHAFAKAVEINPGFALAWYNLSKAHSHKGEKEQVMTKLRRAIKLDPGYKEKARTENLFKKLRGEKEFDRLIR